jgi:pimeloyl-ACP methyl ester carboxylesterase
LAVEPEDTRSGSVTRGGSVVPQGGKPPGGAGSASLNQVAGKEAPSGSAAPRRGTGNDEGGDSAPAATPEAGESGTGFFRRWRWAGLLIAGLALLVTGFVVTRGATSPGVEYEKVSFTSEGYGAGPATISGLLMKPEGAQPGAHPGVVFAHGITGSKEWYIQMTRPLVQAGFVVLNIDLRGHGGSSGYCTYGNEEVADMLAAAGYLAENVPEADAGSLVAMGHSLGGIAATRTGALQDQERFGCTVAIWCWTSFKDALEDFLGPLDDLVGRGWRFVTFSRHIDVNDPDFGPAYSVLDIVDDSVPENFLLGVGHADELASVERVEQILEKCTRSCRESGPEAKLKDNYTYGDFTAGTARRLFVSEDNHVTELASGSLISDATKWMKQSAGIEFDPEQSAPFLWSRLLGLALIGFGIALTSVGAMSAVRGRLFDDTGATFKPAWGTAGEQGIWEIMLYALPVVAASYLALPAAGALGIGPFIPYAGVNEMSIFFLARSLVLSPVFIAILVIVGIQGGMGSITGDKLKRTLLSWVKGAAYALLPVAVAVALMLVLGGPLMLPRAFAARPGYFVLGIVCIGGGLWMEDYLFYKLAYPALSRRNEHSRWMVVGVRGVVLDLVLIAAFLPIMKGPGVSITFMGFDMPLIMLLMLAVLAFLPLAYLSLRLREATGSSLAFALLVTALLVWFLTGPIGVRGF